MDLPMRETVRYERSTRMLVVEQRHGLGFVCTITKVVRVYGFGVEQ